MDFDAILSNIDRVLSFNSSAKVLVFGDFNVHHKGWLIYSDGTNRPGKLLSQMTQLRWLNFQLKSVTVTITVLLIWICLSFNAIICTTMAFPQLGNYHDVVASVSMDFPSS